MKKNPENLDIRGSEGGHPVHSDIEHLTKAVESATFPINLTESEETLQIRRGWEMNSVQGREESERAERKDERSNEGDKAENVTAMLKLSSSHSLPHRCFT